MSFRGRGKDLFIDIRIQDICWWTGLKCQVAEGAWTAGSLEVWSVTFSPAFHQWQPRMMEIKGAKNNNTKEKTGETKTFIIVSVPALAFPFSHWLLLASSSLRAPVLPPAVAGRRLCVSTSFPFIFPPIFPSCVSSLRGSLFSLAVRLNSGFGWFPVL